MPILSRRPRNKEYEIEEEWNKQINGVFFVHHQEKNFR